MAIYHFSAKVIGRSGGRSAVASAAYRAAARLHDDTLGRDHDYTQKAGVIHSEVLLPEGAPERWRDRGTLWNEVEAGEKRRDAQLARDIEIALPRELSRAEAVELARDFVREQFVDRGMVADLNVHWTRAADGELQPHAHVMLTMREVSGLAVVPGQDGQEKRDAGFGKKVVAWNDRGLLRSWRERWAEVCNARLLELGHDVRIDHRSYRDQGIELEPQHKVGPAGSRRSARGEDAERAAEHRAIARRNGDKLLDDPGIALAALTRQHSTFTRQDLARFVDRHTDGAEQFSAVLAKVEAAPELVRLGRDGRGRERFSTREMLECERRLEAAAEVIAGRERHRVLQGAGWRAVRTAERHGLALGEEQRAAFRHVTAGADLALVVGYAGSGKSAMLGVARTAWEAEGYSVRGLALSGIAAEGLEAGSGIASRTLASLEHAWSQGRDALSARDVLVLDEAGMVGSRQLQRLLSAAEQAGAKVVLVGDPEQLQAIEAGAAFRALAERHGAVEITQVRRQRADWQREATRELATGRTAAALERYAEAGMVVEAGTAAEARASLVGKWNQERQADPAAARIILAYTRDDVAALNGLARERMRASGALRGPDQTVQTERGERAFAAGDRIMFLRNERGLGGHYADAQAVAVKNGTLGTVLEVAAGGERLTVRLDGPGGPGGPDGPGGAGQEKGNREVTFYTRDYAHIDHGYAATVHKAQGVTVDRAHVLASPHMDRHAAYVALTRHRDGVVLHYGREDFADAERLARGLSRERAKDTTLDYPAGWVPAAGRATPAGRVPREEGPAIQAGQATLAGRDEDALARRYAELRGLVPDSEIILRREPVREKPPAERQAEAPPRRSRFAGLKLGGERAGPARRPEPVGRAAPNRGQEERETTPLAEARMRTPAEIAREEQLRRGLTAYATAWADAGRMTAAGLPVLAHQAEALERAGQALDGLGPNLAQDTRAALQRAPELARGVGTEEGALALGQAIGATRQARLALDERGRAAVRAWTALERAYEAAGASYDRPAQREAGARLEAFAQELKRDPQLDSLLRQRGRELGIDPGSRLDRVVQAQEHELARTLRRELGISMDRGMGMGM